MSRRHVRSVLASTTAIAAVVLFAATTPASAQPDDNQGESASKDTIVVTGSRIRRSVASTPAPVNTIGQQEFSDRGYTSAAQALNSIPSLTPQLNQAAGDGTSSGSGQQYPSLFGLGAGRTLTLVNGRRFVTTSSGLGDAQVDANVIPTGLIDRIEINEAGGAAVYGSDAIAGVVNYVLKDHFQGLQLDAQTGISEKGDYWTKSIRGTAGTDFAGGRGNVAVDVGWTSTPLLRFSDRPRTNLSRITQGNPADTGPNDGIPSVQEILDAHFWNFNQNGVIYTIPAPPPMFLAQLNGSPIQFSPDGEVVPYDPGTILGIPFARGGDGVRYSDLAGLRTGVDRITANLIGHYDLTDHLKVSTELLYARTVGSDIPQGFARTVLSPPASNSGYIAFTRNNPFLTPDAISDLSTAYPAFGFGAPLFLSKSFYTDLLPSNIEKSKTETYRAYLGLDGDFDAGTRNFYWSLSGSYAQVDGGSTHWDVYNEHFNNALDAVLSGGSIVCGINADLDPTNDDPSCAPFNPFGEGASSEAARSYVTIPAGERYINQQVDILATIGTTLFSLPTGDVQSVLSYEHRYETAKFKPLPANQLGLIGTGSMELPESGSYNTDEIAIESLVPIVGNDFTLPFAKRVELSGTYRYVDNSIAGTESVWSAGARWQVADDLTLRATRSRNFRAPTLTQLFAPSNVILSNAGYDPCDADRISSGPNPAVRLANCQAEWAAHPEYGPLSSFQDPAENFTVTQVTTGGNASLRNEISDTWTYGFVLQPRVIPGFTFSVDRIQIDLTDGLSAFTTEDFAATCYDTSPQPADICSAFTRLAMTDGVSPAGTIVTGRTTTVNAGVVKFRGEVYYADYHVPLDSIFKHGNPGELELAINATHTSLLTTSVTGTTFTRTDNTVAQPDWVGRLDAIYSYGPLRLSYQMYYLSKVLAGPDATIENNPNPVIAANITHSISAQYDFGKVLFRAGIDNFTNKAPSYPSFVHGDILGRRFFFGATLNL